MTKPKSTKPASTKPASTKTSRKAKAPLKRTALATRETAVVKPRTSAELRRLVDDTVDEANRLLKRSDDLRDECADYLFKQLFANDPALALDPNRHLHPDYAAVRAHAGKSLTLDAAELSVYVRIGALTQRLAHRAWNDLDFSLKADLLPLVAADAKLTLLWKGIAYANRPRVGRDLVRAWVRLRTPRKKGSAGRPRALSMAGGQRLVTTGVRLGDDEERQAFAAKMNELTPHQRAEFRRDLEATLKNLAQLLTEIGGDDGEGE